MGFAPQKFHLFSFSLFLVHLIEFTYYWNTHLLMPSYSKKWSAGVFAPSPPHPVQNRVDYYLVSWSVCLLFFGLAGRGSGSEVICPVTTTSLFTKLWNLID